MLSAATRHRDFPSLQDIVYLNTAAEGIPPRAVGDALQEYFRDKLLGHDGRERHFAQWDAARELVGEAFGLSAGEVSICSCSSEAFNWAALALGLRGGDEVVINDLDFPSGATPWLQPNCPATVRLWRHRQGALLVDDLRELLRPATRLVSVSLVSFYNGFMLDLNQVAATVRRHSPALLAVDVPRPLVLRCLEELQKMPVELLTPFDRDHLAGIIAFRHPKGEELARHLRANRVHVMAHAGRLRVALHGYNTEQDVDAFLRALTEAINRTVLT